MAESENVRAHVYVSGRVQGVYYRKNASRNALIFGLTGWVRNLPDRRVEVVVEGERSRVEDFLGWCRDGPSMAIVRGLDVSWEAPTGEYETFRII